MRLIHIGSADIKRAVEVVQQDLAAVGVSVTPQGYPIGEYFGVMGQQEQHMSFWTWWGSPAHIGPSFDIGHFLNLVFHEDAELDEMTDPQRATLDMAERSRILHELQEHVVEEAYWPTL